MSERSIFVWRIAAMAVLAVVFLILALIPIAARGQVPEGAEKYKRELIRNARLEWGMDAPISTFAGQIEQESRFNPEAVSPVGAVGLAQFMPATGKWISGAYPALADNEPRNPQWAMRALAAYDKYLWDRSSAKSDCHHAAKMLSGYNGGARWVTDDEALAARNGLDSGLWWENVERVNSGRSDAAWKENRGYPPAILFLREPRYVDAGWGRGLCYAETH